MEKQVGNLVPLDLDLCRQHLENSVFKLRPSDYRNRYPKWPGLVGIELESLVYQSSSLDSTHPKLAASFSDPEGSASVAKSSIDLATLKGWKPSFFERENDAPEMLKNILMETQDQLTFEPGGQWEYSSSPHPCLNEALTRLTEVQKILDESMAASSFSMLQLGINPWNTTDEIGLRVTKPRYKAMDRYFSQIGPYGRRMMRQTCTVQVNLDFGPDEETMAKRFLLSYLIAPIATGAFAYSPFVDGRLTDFSSFRSRCWRYIDDSRAGLIDLSGIAKQLTKKSCVDAYLGFAMKACVVFVENADHWVPTTPVSFEHWLKNPIQGILPTQSDFETHLSLLFPEARARGFIELRSVDAQSRVWQSVPAVFYCSLLYDPKSLDQALDYLLPLYNRLGDLLYSASFGLHNPELAAAAAKLFTIAEEGLERLPTCFRNDQQAADFSKFRERFVEKKRTPADDLVDAIRKESVFTPTTLYRLEDLWRRI